MDCVSIKLVNGVGVAPSPTLISNVTLQFNQSVNIVGCGVTAHAFDNISGLALPLVVYLSPGLSSSLGSQDALVQGNVGAPGYFNSDGEYIELPVGFFSVSSLFIGYGIRLYSVPVNDWTYRLTYVLKYQLL